MTLLIDNYDSFTYNLAHALPGKVTVLRNDAITRDDVAAMNPERIVLSPGPGSPTQPRDFGVCADLIREPLDVPMLGICLGMQGMAALDGGAVGPAPAIVHGESRTIDVADHPIFAGVPKQLQVGRYHSLAVTQMPSHYQALAESEGVLMAMAHTERPWVGLQFHPESILTPDGTTILENFMELA